MLTDKTLERIAQRYAAYMQARGIGDIDDARQEVLLAWEQCKDCEFPYRETRDYVHKTLAKLHHSRRKYQGFEGYFPRVEQTDENGDTYEIVGKGDDRTGEDVAELLAKLPDKYREVYERKLRGESGQEIADALGLSVNTIWIRIGVARIMMSGYYDLYFKKKKAARREWYVKNRDEILRRAREVYSANSEKKLEHARAYYAAHAEERKRYARKYREANLEKRRKYDRDHYLTVREERCCYNRVYYARNREELCERNLQYRKANRDKIREYKRKYRAENREKILAKQREYREAHREELREKARKYRERKKNENH